MSAHAAQKTPSRTTFVTGWGTPSRSPMLFKEMLTCWISRFCPCQRSGRAWLKYARDSGAASRTIPDRKHGTSTAAARPRQWRYRAKTISAGTRTGLSAIERPKKIPAAVHEPFSAAISERTKPRRTSASTFPAPSVKKTGHAKLSPQRAIAPARPRTRKPNTRSNRAVLSRIAAMFVKKSSAFATERSRAPSGSSIRSELGR
jgi:hypothetical protein